MKIHGVEITADQISAGIAAMTGQFTAWDVRHALAQAGVPSEGEKAYAWVRERVADRLMQSERKVGRIRAINNRKWERVA